MEEVVPVQPSGGPGRGKMIVVLGLMSALGPLSIDAYLPALPRIEEDFGRASGAVELTLSAYFLGLSTAQLGWGLIADRVGRKTPLVFGLVLYVLACTACGLSTSMPSLIASRLVQGIGGAASAVIVRAIVRDLWVGRDAARVMSLMMLVMGAAPILAPLMVTALLSFGWRSIFGMQAFAGLAALALGFLTLPETRGAHEVESPFGAIRVLFRDRKFVALLIAASATQSAMFAYIASAPSIFLRDLHAEPFVFSIVFGLNAAGFVGISQLNRRLVQSHEPIAVARAGAFCMIAAGFALALGTRLSPAPLTFSIHSLSFITTALPVFALMSCLGLMLSNTVVSALEGHGNRAGIASAWIGTAQFACSALSAAGVGVLRTMVPRPAYPLAVMMILGGTLAATMIAASSKLGDDAA